jgi:DNA-binding XRE family transcriptional regulator
MAVGNGGYWTRTQYQLLLPHVPKAREAAIFGESVRRFRKDYEWTQEELADRAGLTTTYVGQVERGDKVPSLTVVLKLAHALEVLPTELMGSFNHGVMLELWG